MAGNILIVEDERSIADNIVYALSTEGFTPIWVQTGADALAKVASESLQLIILDVGLPDISGFELCKRIRQSRSTPLFFLTARADEVDRVLGLEIGADDYITKPFSPRELTARVRAMLRRMETAPSTELKATGPFTIDDSRYQIHFRGENLNLRRYEFGILKMLLAKPGWVYSRQQIMNAIWESPDMSMERTVDAHIKTIRKKIGEIDSTVEWIITHRGLGYSVREQR